MDHYHAILAQIDVIERDVRNNPDPRVVALDHLRQAAAVLGGIVSAPSLVVPLTTSPSFTKTPKAESKIARIEAVVGAYLDREGPTHRSKLVEELTRHGLNEGVKDLLGAFATSMHTLKHRFVSDGKGTFRRVAQDADAPAHTPETTEPIKDGSDAAIFEKAADPPKVSGRPSLTQAGSGIGQDHPHGFNHIRPARNG